MKILAGVLSVFGFSSRVSLGLSNGQEDLVGTRSSIRTWRRVFTEARATNPRGKEDEADSLAPNNMKASSQMALAVCGNARVDGRACPSDVDDMA